MIIHKLLVCFCLILGSSFLTLAEAKTVTVILDAFDGKAPLFDSLDLKEGLDYLDFVVSKDESDEFTHLYQPNSIVCQALDFSRKEIRKCLRQITQKRKRIDYITAASKQDWIIYRGSEFREEFHSKAGSAPETSVYFYDKYLMKKRILAAGVPTAPMTEANLKSAHSFVKEHGFPVVIKPRRKSSSEGVRFLKKMSEVTKVLKTIDPDQHLLEKFVAGGTYRADGIYNKGQIVSMLAFKDTPSCYDYYIKRLPAVESLILDEAELHEIQKVVQASLDALKYETGVFHMELIKNKKTGFNFLEVAGRPGGGGGRKLLLNHFGIDFSVEMMRLDTGLPVRPLSLPKLFGWALSVPTPEAKRSFHYKGLDRSIQKQYPSLVEIEAPKPGHKVPKYGAIGFYFISSDEEQIKKDHHDLMKNLKIEFIP